MKRALVVLLLLAAVPLSIVMVCRADALPPPPRGFSCRPPQIVQPSHAGYACVDVPCMTTAECPSGTLCVRMCSHSEIRDPTHCPAAGGSKEAPSPCDEVWIAGAPCGADGSCPAGDTCGGGSCSGRVPRPRRHTPAPPAPPRPPAASSTGPQSPLASLLGLGLPALAGVIVLRRRR